MTNIHLLAFYFAFFYIIIRTIESIMSCIYYWNFNDFKFDFSKNNITIWHLNTNSAVVFEDRDVVKVLISG